MHVIQYVAVRAEDVESAHERVSNYLETELEGSPWFDWFVVGGGRWATNVEENQYNQNWTGDIAPLGDPRFFDYLDKAKQYRREVLAEYKSEAGEVDLAAIVTGLDTWDGSNADYDVTHKMYALKRIYEITSGTWDCDSYYFDVETESTNMVHLQVSLDKDNKDWYIVPVDFHF